MYIHVNLHTLQRVSMWNLDVCPWYRLLLCEEILFVFLQKFQLINEISQYSNKSLGAITLHFFPGEMNK